MTQLTEMLERLREIASRLHALELIMRERLPIMSPTIACAGCGKALDHLGPSKYCVACAAKRTAEAWGDSQPNPVLADHQNEHTIE